MNTNKPFILVSLLLTLLLAACVPVDATTGSIDEAAETVTVTHPQGETTVVKNPETIVVFDYSALDTLDQLGIPVAGVPQGTAIPPFLTQYTSDEYANVGTLFEPDFEQVNALQPDLIIIGGRSAAQYEALSEIAPTLDVSVDASNYVETFGAYINNLGLIFDKESEVEERLAALDARIAEVQALAESTGAQGLIIMTNGGEVAGYGPGSRFGMIHDMFGVAPTTDTMVAETHGDTISFEFILEQNPDVIYVIDRDSAIGQEAESAQQVMDNELVASTNAGSNDNIVYMDSAAWYLANAGLSSFETMINDVASGLE